MRLVLTLRFEVFFSTSDRDAVGAYRDHIASAKESVDVSTHLLNNDEIIASLEAAKVRGAHVRAVVGKPGTQVTQDKDASLRSCLERGPSRFLCSLTEVKQCLGSGAQTSPKINSSPSLRDATLR